MLIGSDLSFLEVGWWFRFENVQDVLKVYLRAHQEHFKKEATAGFTMYRLVDAIENTEHLNSDDDNENDDAEDRR